MKEFTYKAVINKSRYGRVLLVKNFKTGKYFALKYYHKWKLMEYAEDDFFLGLALKISKYVFLVFDWILRNRAITRRG